MLLAPPEGYLPLFQPLQQALFAIDLPEHLPLDGVYRPLRELEGLLQVVDVLAEVAIGGRIHDVLVDHLLLGLERGQSDAVDVLAGELGEAEDA